MAVVLPFVATFVDKGAKEAVKSIKKVESQWGKFGDGLKKAAVPAAAVGGALVAGLTNAKKSAGDAAKSQKVLKAAMANAGYEENAKAASDYAVQLSKATGMDQSAIRVAQSKLAANDQLASSTTAMGKATSLAADMVAQGYGTMEGNAVILAKALEDPAKGMLALNRMGITFSRDQQAEIKAAMKAGDQAMAQQLLIAGVTATVGGAAEKNASSTAKMRAAYTDLAIQIGSALLPAFGKIAAVLTTVINWMSQNIGVTKLAIAVVGGLVTVILALNVAMKVQATVTNATTAAHKIHEAMLKRTATSNAVVTAATGKSTASIIANKVASLASAAAQKALSIAQKAGALATRGMAAAQRSLNAAMKANPIGFVIGLVMALVTALMYAWRNSETFRRIVTQAFNAVKDVAQRVFSAIASAIQPVINLLSRIIDLAKNVASAIGNVISKIPGLGKASSAAAAAGKSTAVGPYVAAGSAGGPSVVINVQGAIDPERTARQIRAILDAHDVRQNRMVAQAVAW